MANFFKAFYPDKMGGGGGPTVFWVAMKMQVVIVTAVSIQFAAAVPATVLKIRAKLASRKQPGISPIGGTDRDSKMRFRSFVRKRPILSQVVL